MVAARREDSVKERLLAAADELFYEEGVHTVGIDRILERAGVAKASLYGTFGSKEELVCAYLTRRSEARQADITSRMAKCASPEEKALSVFDLLSARVADAKFRGCPFLNASIEGPRGASPIRLVARKHRAWVLATFEGLAREMGVDDPRRTAVQLSILYDGAIVGSLMEATPETADFARRMATLLIEAEFKSRAKSKRPKPRARATASP